MLRLVILIHPSLKARRYIAGVKTPAILDQKPAERFEHVNNLCFACLSHLLSLLFGCLVGTSWTSNVKLICN